MSQRSKNIQILKQIKHLFSRSRLLNLNNNPLRPKKIPHQRQRITRLKLRLNSKLRAKRMRNQSRWMTSPRQLMTHCLEILIRSRWTHTTLRIGQNTYTSFRTRTRTSAGKEPFKTTSRGRIWNSILAPSTVFSQLSCKSLLKIRIEHSLTLKLNSSKCGGTDRTTFREPRSED